jgi:hypothetical protein
LKGFKNGKAHNNIITNPMIQTTRASYLKPSINADPEKALPGGLNDQKIIKREMVITASNTNTTEKIHRNSFGTRCKNSMNNYLMSEQI